MAVLPGERYPRPEDARDNWPSWEILDYMSQRRDEEALGEEAAEPAVFIETLSDYQVGGVIAQVGPIAIEVGPHRVMNEEVAAFTILRQPPLQRGDRPIS